MKYRLAFTVILGLAVALVQIGCSGAAEKSDRPAQKGESTRTQEAQVGQASELAVIETELGEIVIEFHDDVAPKHVESFKILARQGYFDGTTFHRVIPGFVIQGGDPNSRDDDRFNDGMGGHAGRFYGFGQEDEPSTWTLPAEFNYLPHRRGAVSMARSQDINSAGSQFFICVADAFRLDGQYSVFGTVIEGMDVVDRIVNAETPKKRNPKYSRADRDNPLKPIPMKVRIVAQEEIPAEARQ